MNLDILNDGEITTVERVEYFEVRTSGVYVERDGTSEAFDGEIAGGTDI